MTSTPLAVATNNMGESVEIHPSKVVIRRKGLMTAFLQGSKGNKEIPLRSITAVQFKKNDWISPGYIQFTVAGGIESRGGWLDGLTDENSVTFRKPEEPSFERVKDAIDRLLSAPQTDSRRNEQPTEPVDVISRLERLAELKERGVLTEAEFQAQKKALLAQTTSPPAREEEAATCPFCNASLPLDALRVGKNTCPHCGNEFEAE